MSFLKAQENYLSKLQYLKSGISEKERKLIEIHANIEKNNLEKKNKIKANILRGGIDTGAVNNINSVNIMLEDDKENLGYELEALNEELKGEELTELAVKYSKETIKEANKLRDSTEAIRNEMKILQQKLNEKAIEEQEVYQKAKNLIFDTFNDIEKILLSDLPIQVSQAKQLNSYLAAESLLNKVINN